ncbi:MAG: alginate export family protein [Phycisphaerales bacterium]|nr:MAG: alginate export family protein [Phycisphaerales bacterium]
MQPQQPDDRRCLSIRISLILILLSHAIAPADPDDCPPGCNVCALKEKANTPVPGLTWGADLRLRSEHLDNGKLDEEEERSADVWRQRVRTRVWTKAQPMDNVTLACRLTAEPWYFSEPDSLDEQFTRDEALIDQLFVNWQNQGTRPLQITAGRQDIRLGDGWLVRRGTPRDSSRTNFFDALRTTLILDNHHSDLDLIYLRNHANSSWLARPFNDADLDLSEQDATGVIVYGRYRRVPNTELDAYFIYKHDDRVAVEGNDADIYTLGLRTAGPLSSGWSCRAELAPQFGHKNGTDLCALGFTGLLSYALNDACQSELRVGYEYRSGDHDPNGAFDILWGRYGSNVANLFGGAAALEGQVSHLSNFHRLRVGWTGDLTDNLRLACDYGPMFRDENPWADTTGFSDDGTVRGHLVTGSASYQISRHASTDVLGEVFFPGDYYEAPYDDTATYLRWQMMLVW